MNHSIQPDIAFEASGHARSGVCPFYYPQVFDILAPCLVLENLNVRFDYLLYDLS